MAIDKTRDCFSAGHGLGSRDPGKIDPGAIGKFDEEWEMARVITRHLAQDSAAFKMKTLFRDTGFYALADDAANAFGAGTFTEIHFNSFYDSSVSGVECLVGPNATTREKRLAEYYCAAVSETLKIPNRGVKVRDNLAVLKQYGDMDSVLLEIAFISNPNDMKKFHDLHEKLELALFNARRKVDGKVPINYLPRKTWRIGRLPRYLRTV